MNNFTQIKMPKLDTALALNDLAANSDLFQQITIRQLFIGSDHKDTETIYLRGPRGFTPEQYMTPGESVNYSQNISALNSVAELIDACTDALSAQDLGHVLVVKLKAGGVVTEHIDEGAYADHYKRFHLVLSTNDGCTMKSGDETMHMAAGNLYLFNHKLPHSFTNAGDTDRIHVIFDCIPGVRVK
ncbi:MAG TPA: hypothetical protein DCY64_22615 [Hydrogenophaga sp.]|uniref:aspartyl/asparaginyl beta-hydroxylase domain-containing protein n=1 Tax=Hydrogenophaga sp. TaxID=1904254 RepID=UPI0008B33FBD|nr:aspartyl/asparaginyl beta-hydroxylase domain-containing protein [Hydrogenophaga sp.]OGA78779.1 MAG: hypothetical protein A2X73_07455 [Burkholderiales bacterium GWE1_65_30]OGA89350.1 MAG: hypothetical protein A2X72_16615 [Burkholderiales bacterium GWF1_66_17]HAX23065.1 hypothetical protein [Hydrogenophaga sp.]HBU17071.1 hypothetical protein [Hydrogenophaga sp.]